MKQFQCTFPDGSDSEPYTLEKVASLFPQSYPSITGLEVGEKAVDRDGDSWVRLPDFDAEQKSQAERLERIATPVFAAMINASPMLSAHVLATTAVDFAKALIAELDKQA